MAACELKVRSSVRDVALSKSGRLVGVLRSQEVDVLEWDPLGAMGAPYSPRGQLNLSTDYPDSFLRQVVFLAETDLFILLNGPGGSIIVQCRLDQQGLQFIGPIVQSPSTILRIVPRSDHQALCFEDNAHQVYDCHLPNDREKSLICQFPEAAPWFDCIKIGSKVSSKGASIKCMEN